MPPFNKDEKTLAGDDIRTRSIDFRTLNIFPEENNKTLREWTERHADQGATAAFFEGFGSIELLAQGGQVLLQDTPDSEIDPTYSQRDFLAARPDIMASIQPFVDNPGLPGAQSFLENFATSENASVAEFKVRQLEAARERAEQFARHPVAGSLGIVSGLATDFVALAILETVTLGAATPLMATMLGSARNARTAAMAVTGAGLGAGEGAVAQALQAQLDPTVSPRDIATWGFLGAALGGGAGAGVGRFLDVRDARKAMKERNASAQARMQQSTGGSLSAAAVPKEPLRSNTPARGAGSVVSRFLGENTLLSKWLRGGGQIVVDRGVRGRKEFEKEGLTGNQRFFNTMSRVFHFNVKMEEDLLVDPAARSTAVNTILQEFEGQVMSQNRRLQGFHAEMQKDLFGTAGLETKLKETGLSPFRNQVTLDDYTNMVNEYRYAVGNGLEEFIPRILDQVEGLSDDQAAKLLDHIKKAAPSQDALMDDIGKAMVFRGVITEDELLPGFTPQLWIGQRVSANYEAVRAKFLEAWSRVPDRAWVNQHLGPDDTPWGPDEDFLAFRAHDPEKAEDLLEDWAAGVRDEAAEKHEAILAAARQEAKDLRGELASDIETRILKNQKVAAEKIRRLESQMVGAKAHQVQKIQDEVALLKQRIRDEELKLDELNGLNKASDELDAFIRSSRRGTQAARRALKKVVAAEAKATKAARAASVRKLVTEQVDEVVNTLAGGKDPLGRLPDNILGSSGRTKARSIFLGELRFDPVIRSVLRTSGTDINNSLIADVGPDLSFREAFGIVGAGKKISRNDVMQGVRNDALRGFEDDLKKTTGRRLQKVRRDMKTAGDIFDEFTKSHFLDQMVPTDPTGRKIADTTGFVQSLTAASALGFQAVSQLTDAATMIFATPGGVGDLLKTAFGGPSGRQMREVLKGMGRDEMLLALEGINEQGLGRFAGMADIDVNSRLYDVPGSVWNKVTEGARNLAVAEGHLNFATGMTRALRKFFGKTLVMNANRELRDFGNLSKSRRAWYAQLGIDAKAAKRMAQLLDEAGLDVGNGNKVPDPQKWAEMGEVAMLRKWDRFIIEGGNNAIIAPQRGDRSFIANNDWGRMMSQFTSFMFAASNRVTKPLMQNFLIAPTEMRNVSTALAGLFLANLSGALRAHIRGEEEAWWRKWETPEGQRDLLYEALLRSPFMAGFSGPMVDMLSGWFGGGVNDMTEALVGIRPFQEATHKVRNPVVANLFVGPGAGIVGDNLLKAGVKISEGDFEGAGDIAMKRLPVLNIFYLQLAQSALKGEL